MFSVSMRPTISALTRVYIYPNGSIPSKFFSKNIFYGWNNTVYLN